MSATSLLERQAKQFNDIDEMSPDLRQCVHEYGYSIVARCLEAGVRKPTLIHALVREIWEGARASRQKRSSRCSTLDWLLIQAGAQISAAELARVFLNNNLRIVPRTPTDQMIQASLAEVTGYNVVCTKWEKHKRRLDAALGATEDYFAISSKPRSGGNQ